jgi:uncharacterized glyoxalase superfamily protein PhnB
VTPGPAVRSFHLYLETRSFREALAFWSTLGFELVREWTHDGKGAGRLESGAAVVVIAESDDPQLAVHLHTSDIDALERKLVARGRGSIVEPPEETHWGTRWMWVRDPDGRVFALETETDENSSGK